jgi:glycogen debranching enzyme
MFVLSQLVSVLDGSTFAVSDAAGDITANSDVPMGLFYRDMRHLSQWEMRLNGRPLHPLTGHATEYDEAIFFLIEPTGSPHLAPSVSVLRRRQVADGMREDITVTNHGLQPVPVQLSVLFAADFADVFEIRDQLNKHSRQTRRVVGDRVTLEYRRNDYRRYTVVSADGASFSEKSLSLQMILQPAQSWQLRLEVRVSTERLEPSLKADHRPDLAAGMAQWLAGAPRLDTDWDDLRRVYQRSLVDLAALRFYPDLTPPFSLPAAGLPWYMALFGRDSLIASYQALPFAPELCRTTLRALAALQATDFDDFRDSEPGKIMHEVRYGDLIRFRERPQSPYYGSADATPLYLIVLDEYERWTGDGDLVRELEPSARAALRWVEEYGDLDGDGFIEYASRNPDTGLANQCWKDSTNSIVYPDGEVAPLPRATCEIQGYAYDARLRFARLAREFWGDPALADRLEHDARTLRRRFDEAFWLPDRGFYALALDGDGHPVPTLTSNIGHLLWSGIVADDHVDRLVANLLCDQMFSGWGVRTLAAGQPAYNPIEYHNGTVWPHDNALIAAGLARYGRRTEANRLAVAILEAARFFDDRLPEVLVGTDRRETRVPVPLATACCPQAWAAGTPLLLIRVMLGLRPGPFGPEVDPCLPERIERLGLDGVHGQRGRAELVGAQRPY